MCLSVPKSPLSTSRLQSSPINNVKTKILFGGNFGHGGGSFMNPFWLTNDPDKTVIDSFPENTGGRRFSVIGSQDDSLLDSWENASCVDTSEMYPSLSTIPQKVRKASLFSKDMSFRSTGLIHKSTRGVLPQKTPATPLKRRTTKDPQTQTSLGGSFSYHCPLEGSSDNRSHPSPLHTHSSPLSKGVSQHSELDDMLQSFDDFASDIETAEHVQKRSTLKESVPSTVLYYGPNTNWSLLGSNYKDCDIGIDEDSFLKREGLLIGPVINNGCFSVLHEVTGRGGQNLILKVINEPIFGKENRLRKLNEICCIFFVSRHKNMIEVIFAWEIDRIFKILMPRYEGGNLRDEIEKRARSNRIFSEHETWSFLFQAGNGLKHIHDSGVVHLDVRPENILFCSDGVVKVGDFGHARFLNSCIDCEPEGDSIYLAPESLNGIFGKFSDIFSLGMIVLEMLTMVDFPGSGEEWHRLRNNDFSGLDLSKVSWEMGGVCKLMLERDFNKRPVMGEVIDICERVLCDT